MKKIAFLIVLFSLLTVACKEEVKADVPPMMATTTFTIEGMHCEVGCAARVQKKLAKLEGVNEASVDFEGKLATVTHDVNKQKPEDLVALVLKLDNTYVVTNENTTMN